jgi:hypothetical protein
MCVPSLTGKEYSTSGSQPDVVGKNMVLLSSLENDPIDEKKSVLPYLYVQIIQPAGGNLG